MRKSIKELRISPGDHITDRSSSPTFRREMETLRGGALPKT